MRLTRQEIQTEALRLGIADRQQLAEDLLLSLSDDDREQLDALWLAEAHRRDAAYTSGEAKGKPIDVVLERLRAKSAP